jgi:hypothetical protein
MQGVKRLLLLADGQAGGAPEIVAGTLAKLQHS